MERNSRVSYLGYDYTIKNATDDASYFRCSHHRSSGCTATLILRRDPETYRVNGLHKCVTSVHGNGGVVDLREEMRTLAVRQATHDLSTTATTIWNSVNALADTQYAEGRVVVKEKKTVIINLVHTTRHCEIGTDAHSIVRNSRYAQISEADRRPFFFHGSSYLLPESVTQQERHLHDVFLWGHPELLLMLRRRNCVVFIDGTFKCVPHPFQQCVILMTLDDETNLFVPVVFGLLDNKTSWAFWHYLHAIFVETETKFNPAVVVSDFEAALLQAIDEQLPSARRVGCLFHFKQALRRKMVKMNFAETSIRAAMERGSLDVLTTVKRSNVEKKLKELEENMQRTDEHEKWKSFFSYFKQTWMMKYGVELWNHSTKQKEDEIVHRTNNALESFNRRLNDRFGNAHPNLAHFIDVIREISMETMREVENLRRGVSRRPAR